jgi:uncharacterized membrane protein YccF (DUF307 family)
MPSTSNGVGKGMTLYNSIWYLLYNSGLQVTHIRDNLSSRLTLLRGIPFS